MKDLSGKLEIIESLALLQMLNNAQVTGKLRVTNKTNRASIWFDDGHISFADIAKRKSMLGEYLVGLGVVEERTVAEFLRAKRKSEKLGELLVQSGVVSRDAVRHAIGTQIREVVYEVVGWQEGRFSFAAGERPVGQDILNDVPLDHLVLEGVRRLDETVNA